MLSVSCCRAFAGSLTSPRCDLSGVDGVPPDMADLLEVFQVSLISWPCFIRKKKSFHLVKFIGFTAFLGAAPFLHRLSPTHHILLPTISVTICTTTVVQQDVANHLVLVLC